MHTFSDKTEQAPRFFFSGSSDDILTREQAELIHTRKKLRQALLVAKPFRAQYGCEDDWEHDQEVFADTFKAFEKITDWIVRREHRINELIDADKFTNELVEKVVPHSKNTGKLV